MSTTELGRFDARSVARPAAAADVSVAGVARTLIAPLASLRLTVALLSLSIVLVLAGTLAQVDHDLLYVLKSYFRTWIAWIEVQIFFPRSWGIRPDLVVPFPGGKLIGLALAVNLVAAHAVRFTIAAHGRRLWLGAAAIAAGCGLTYAVIASGANTAIESELSLSFTYLLWNLLRAALGGAALTLAYVLALSYGKASQSAAWWLWLFGAAVAAILAGLAAYLLLNPSVRLDAAGLRILWQLAKALAASAVLGAGCWAVFSKRAGIVLLHGGIGLMMFTELYTVQHVVEARMSIEEGETAHYAFDIRKIELAFTDAADRDVDRVTVVPGEMLAAAARSGETISHPDLPFDVRVARYAVNSVTRRLQPGEQPLSATGLAALYTLDERPETSGVAAQQTVDLPGAIVELLDKKSGASRGVHLASLELRGEPVEADGKTFDMELRFKRIPKPYEVTLLDFKHETYAGAPNTPKNFESIVQFRDPAKSVDRRVSIRMNNPLRYGGDTLYQADWNKATERGTVLQVMTNSGWMIPYVGCMIVAAGMLLHFGQALVRFVARREGEARLAAAKSGGQRSADAIPWSQRWKRAEFWVPALVVLLAAAMTLQRANSPTTEPLQMNIYEFGRLPVACNGRMQPLDTLAQNTLRLVSGKATFQTKSSEKSQPAIRWLLDAISLAPSFRDHRVIRIENLEVLESLDLPQRPGDWRYSLAEVMKNGEFQRQWQLARSVPEDQRDLPQAKMIEAADKVNRILGLIQAFSLPEARDVVGNPARIEQAIQDLNAFAPKPVPPERPDGEWLTVYEAAYDYMRAAQANPAGEDDENSGLMKLFEAITAYHNGEPAPFNAALADYRKIVAKAAADEAQAEQILVDAGEPSHRKPAERLNLDRLAFEAWFNHFDPFIICLVFYIAAFVLAALAWFGWPRMLNRSANWLLWFTFALHTYGLLCRIYLSGRPPVTNLYSSAVFIGWAAVLFGLLFEAIYKLGLGNLVAAVIGVPTMFIAYQLVGDPKIDGDTLGVMQAVLDTNFWLGTHVVCIALGYATTLLAAGLGLLTITMGYIRTALDDDQRRQLTRMTYGALCFAIFFSLIGTVLGGLWADDSWGRFWGWDPKENGALMIVLWNAIVLHARWGKMVGERGFAALAMVGGIVVAWSWWGVNQLGVGLHAYGKAAGITEALMAFDVLMLGIIAAAYLLPMLKNPPPKTPTAAA
jgi:ABC-type transport system involved in cytochrome c biogenesis permease subunit